MRLKMLYAATIAIALSSVAFAQQPTVTTAPARTTPPPMTAATPVAPATTTTTTTPTTTTTTTTAARPATRAPLPAGTKINLNTATAEQLDSLPQIGKARTKVIMTERAKSPFKDWADFDTRMQHTSVNAGVKAKIKDAVTF